MADSQRRFTHFGSPDALSQPVKDWLEEHARGASNPEDTAAADVVIFSGEPARRVAELQLAGFGYLNSLPDAVAFLDDQQTILWHNQIMATLLKSSASLVGQPLAAVIQGETVEGEGSLQQLPVPERPGEWARLTIGCPDRTCLGLRVARCCPNSDCGVPAMIAVTLRDVTAEVQQHQKQEAIYRAGLEFGNLTAEEVTQMRHEDRLALLKENILHFTHDILGYDTFEIRILNRETNELMPLVEFGMDPEAASRRLYALPEDNGVTGYVASTGSSYLCHDTQSDPHYIRGSSAARSSLTIPLKMRDDVLGTFNVESPGTVWFDQKHLDFLVLFGRVIANALNQLQLLVAEKVTTVSESSDQIRRQVAAPTDEILHDATWILERYIGHDPDVCDRLHRIVSSTRQISGQVGNVSSAGATISGIGTSPVPRQPRPELIGKRILVIDSDSVAREDAHNLLGQMGCIVEAVRSAENAFRMVRSHHYDVVLTDIRLPDMNGYDCFVQLRRINGLIPIIMMTGFGYDPTHSIVNARKEGLKAVLYKPFRRGQLLDEVEKAVVTPPPTE